MDIHNLSRSQLETIVLVGRKEFLTRPQASVMADVFYEQKIIQKKRLTVGEYLGNKIANLSIQQLVAAAKYVRSEIGEDCYKMLSVQCGIPYKIDKQLEAA